LPQDIVPLIGALYEVITLSHTKSPSLQINPEVRSSQELLSFQIQPTFYFSLGSAEVFRSNESVPATY